MSKFQDMIFDALKVWFPKEQMEVNYRPDWLKGLELDFYFPKWRIGIEVDGQQHYRHVPELQKTAEDFTAQVARDGCKELLCIRKNVKLVHVSPSEDCAQQLRRALIGCGIGRKRIKHLPHSIFKAISDYGRKFGFAPKKRFSFTRRTPPTVKDVRIFQRQQYFRGRTSLTANVVARY